MSSLSRHLMIEAGHATLPYHPECPICRADRLEGPPPDTAVLGPRGRALLLAATLGFAVPASAAAVAFPRAASADEEFTGPAGGFSPGELQQIQQTPAGDLPPSAEAPEPPDEPGDPPVETVTTPPVAPPPGPQVAPAPPPAVPQPPAVPLQVPPPPHGTPAPPAVQPPAPKKSQPANPKPEPRPDKPVAAPRREPEPVAATRSEPAPVATRPRGTALRSEAVIAPTRAADPAAAATPEPAPPGANGVHVVASGESLWSIAAKRLGPGASAAEIAREVNRIWNLNASSIRSGQPDLIMVGERLRMR